MFPPFSKYSGLNYIEDDLKGNEICFKLAGGSSYRRFKLPGVDCISFKIQFTNETHHFSTDPQSGVEKRNSLLFQRNAQSPNSKKQAELNELRKIALFKNLFAFFIVHFLLLFILISFNFYPRLFQVSTCVLCPQVATSLLHDSYSEDSQNFETKMWFLCKEL